TSPAGDAVNSSTEETLLQAIAAHPADATAWLALADCLEEQGRLQQAELVRLREWLRFAARGDPLRRKRERQLLGLLAKGVLPVVPRRCIDLPGGATLDMVLIPPGTFWMGDEDDREAGDDKPRHQVTLTRGFWMSATLITQRQWRSVNARNPSQW